MSDKSANLKLPFIQSAQAQKHITHNDAITNFDILTQLTVEDKDLPTPPSSPAEGDCYIVASVATAVWTGKENQLAAWGKMVPGGFMNQLKVGSHGSEMKTLKLYLMEHSGMNSQVQEEAAQT